MRKRVNKKRYPFGSIVHARDMMPLEQILIMVWLADNHTIKELRERQHIINCQLQIACDKNLPETTFEDLGMMLDNTTAAIAFQTFTDLDTWMAFIQFPEGQGL